MNIYVIAGVTRSALPSWRTTGGITSRSSRARSSMRRKLNSWRRNFPMSGVGLATSRPASKCSPGGRREKLWCGANDGSEDCLVSRKWDWDLQVFLPISTWRQKEFIVFKKTIKYLFRFLAEDQNSGRREYLISRERQLEVTDLTLASVRTSDPRLVSITGTILQGHHPGAADIQVHHT